MYFCLAPKADRVYIGRRSRDSSTGSSGSLGSEVSCKHHSKVQITTIKLIVHIICNFLLTYMANSEVIKPCFYIVMFGLYHDVRRVGCN